MFSAPRLSFLRIVTLYGFCLFILSTHTGAQENTHLIQQQLFSNYYTISINDLIRLYNVQQDGKKLYTSQPDSAIHYYRLAAHGFNRIGAYEKAANLYGEIAIIYKGKRAFSTAANSLKQSIVLYRLAGETDSVIWKSLALCNLYYLDGAYDNIKRLYSNLLPLFNNAGPRRQEALARINNVMGVIYFQNGNYDSASRFYLKVINAFRSFDSSNYTVYCDARLGLGNIATRLGNYGKAIAYYQQVVSLTEKYKDTLSKTKLLVNIGSFYAEQKNYKKATQLSKEALDLSLKKKYYDCASISAQTMASLLIKSGKAAEALPYSKISYQNAVLNGSFAYRTNAAYVLGFNYVQLGQFQKAVRYLLPALEDSKKKGQVDNMINAYNQLAVAYQGMKRYQEAYNYKQAYIDLKDSLMGKENAERVTRLEIQFKTAEKDKELSRQKLLVSQKENKIREKNTWLLTTAISGISASLLIFGWFFGRQKLQRKQLEIESLNARMEGEEMERGRIARELHDGVSVLLSATQMNCTSLAREDNSIGKMSTYQEIVHLVNEISVEVRNISYNLVPEMLARQSLPAAIQSFCESVSKGHHISIEVEHHGVFHNLDATFCYSIYRIVQELVHNALKHSEANNILVQLILLDRNLHVTVEDNGKGFEYDSIDKGMGLDNLKKRIHHLNAELSIRSEKNTGTTIEIELFNIPGI